MKTPRVVSHFFVGFKGLGDSRRMAILMKEGRKYDFLVPLARPLRIRKVLKCDRKYWEFEDDKDLLKRVKYTLADFSKYQEDVPNQIRNLYEHQF